MAILVPQGQKHEKTLNIKKKGFLRGLEENC